MGTTRIDGGVRRKWAGGLSSEYRCDESPSPVRSNPVREPDDEVVAVGHLHLGERLRIHDLALADDLVEREQIRGHGVGVIVAETPRHIERHRAADEVEHGGGVSVEVADRLYRLD